MQKWCSAVKLGAILVLLAGLSLAPAVSVYFWIICLRRESCRHTPQVSGPTLSRYIERWVLNVIVRPFLILDGALHGKKLSIAPIKRLWLREVKTHRVNRCFAIRSSLVYLHGLWSPHNQANSKEREAAYFGLPSEAAICATGRAQPANYLRSRPRSRRDRAAWPRRCRD